MLTVLAYPLHNALKWTVIFRSLPLPVKVTVPLVGPAVCHIQRLVLHDRRMKVQSWTSTSA